MTHPHLPPESTAEDGPFLRAFGVALVLLLVAVGGLVVLVDPLARFGTGLVPPVVTTDRDQQAALYRGRHPIPSLAILGSSRSKTLDPGCFSRVTGKPAFNFAVNGAGTEDFLAILRFLRVASHDALSEIYVGVDPETLQGDGGVHRALSSSRALAPYLPAGNQPLPRASVLADLYGWQAVEAAVHSLLFRPAPAPGLPTLVLQPDGRQDYPRAERGIADGTFDEPRTVLQSIPGILTRYQAFPALDPERTAYLRQFVREAADAGIRVTAFIPPVHPAFVRAASLTPWRERSAETVALLQSFESPGQFRYVETRLLPVDSLRFVDAIHFLSGPSALVAETLLDAPGRCAVQ